MPETTYNPSITVDTGLYCPVCRGAIQANLTDSSVGPIVWDVFCDACGAGEWMEDPIRSIFEEFIEETAPLNFDMGWSREAWDNYHQAKAEAAMDEHSFIDRMASEGKNASLHMERRLPSGAPAL